jgi:hypothetical protein
MFFHGAMLHLLTQLRSLHLNAHADAHARHINDDRDSAREEGRESGARDKVRRCTANTLALAEDGILPLRRRGRREREGEGERERHGMHPAAAAAHGVYDRRCSVRARGRRGP